MDQTSLNVSRPASAEWIAGRVQALLFHFYKPDAPTDVEEAALADWVVALKGYSEAQIEGACDAYLKDEVSNRPTPARIRAKIPSFAKSERTGAGDRSALSHDEVYLLDMEILPRARRWLTIPGLKSQGERILAHWGEA